MSLYKKWSTEYGSTYYGSIENLSNKPITITKITSNTHKLTFYKTYFSGSIVKHLPYNKFLIPANSTIELRPNKYFILAKGFKVELDELTLYLSNNQKCTYKIS